ncbi:MAG: hypothetical protein F6K65_05485 [Moorea sp. SIO3C2]|nr:hypothetical protein [Moorena sp. SIO3C2]
MKKNQDYQKGSSRVTKKMPHLSKPQAVVLAMDRSALLNHLPLPIGQFFPDFYPSIPVLSSA